MRLGCSASSRSSVSQLPRFNEAEAHAPRMRWPADPARSHRRGFNEAEAHAPRMPSGSSPDRRPMARFNEAEAHAPRMLMLLLELRVPLSALQ